MKSAKEISEMLSVQAEGVVHYLLPDGKRVGNEWKVGDVDGNTGKSLSVRLSGEKSGVWCDFSSPHDKGDLLDLWCSVRKIGLSEAIKEASSYLCLEVPTFIRSERKIFKRPDKKETDSSTKSEAAQYLSNRAIFNTTIEQYKISQEGRKIVFPYIRDGEIIIEKYLNIDRENGKKFISCSKDCEPCLFGWHIIPKDCREITICEGEIDAMSLKEYSIPALSVPFGATNHQWVEHEFERLSVYDKIYICFDNDDAGKNGALELSQRLGKHRCYIVTLPFKDANECLMKNVTYPEIKACFDSAKTQDPEELRRGDSFTKDILSGIFPSDETFMGYSAPWSKTAGKVLFRPQELSIWTGINGHGKSQFLGQILLGCMEQGAKICIASLELSSKRLLTRLTKQASGMSHPSPDYISKISEWYGDKLWLFALLGSAKSKRLIEVMKYAKQRYGISVFVIDSFMMLDIAEDDYKGQKSFIEALCDFKNQYDCHIHLVVHPRKGADENRVPGKLDNKGTGAISDLADNCFTIWRNKEKEHVVNKKESGHFLDEDEENMLVRPDCIWSCDKQRNGEWEGRFSFWFDKESMQYLCDDKIRPRQFVDFHGIPC